MRRSAIMLLSGLAALAVAGYTHPGAYGPRHGYAGGAWDGVYTGGAAVSGAWGMSARHWAGTEPEYGPERGAMNLGGNSRRPSSLNRASSVAVTRAVSSSMASIVARMPRRSAFDVRRPVPTMGPETPSAPWLTPATAPARC